MILVDTSIWIDHLRAGQRALVDLLEQAQVTTHPFVVAELALGSITRRREFLTYLADLPVLGCATHEEFMAFIEAHALFGRGLSLVDAHLLAAVLLVPGPSVWTRDRGLAAAARGLGVEAQGCRTGPSPGTGPGWPSL